MMNAVREHAVPARFLAAARAACELIPTGAHGLLPRNRLSHVTTCQWRYAMSTRLLHHRSDVISGDLVAQEPEASKPGVLVHESTILKMRGPVVGTLPFYVRASRLVSVGCHCRRGRHTPVLAPD